MFSKDEQSTNECSINFDVFKQVIKDMLEPGKVVGGGKTGRGDYTIMGVKMG